MKTPTNIDVLRDLADSLNRNRNQELIEQTRNEIHGELLAQARPLSMDDASGVYFLFDGTEMVYVGQSGNMFTRIGNHIGERLKVFTSYVVVHMPKEDRLALEKVCIEIFRPKYNLMSQREYGFILWDEAKEMFGLTGEELYNIVFFTSVRHSGTYSVFAPDLAEYLEREWQPQAPVESITQEKLF